MNEEQMKILETEKNQKKNTETIFRWCISQGPARKRKISLDSFNRGNLIQGIFYTGDRKTEKPTGDGQAFQKLKTAGSCYHSYG